MSGEEFGRKQTDYDHADGERRVNNLYERFDFGRLFCRSHDGRTEYATVNHHVVDNHIAVCVAQADVQILQYKNKMVSRNDYFER